MRNKQELINENNELYDKIDELIENLHNQLEEKSNYIDIDKLIRQMKIDNVYTYEFDEYLDNYFKFYEGK